MSLTVNAGPAFVSGAGGTNAVTSASFTPAANSLVVVRTACNGTGSGTDTTVTITDTGGGLTWTRQARKNVNAGSTGGAGTAGGAEVWTAPAGASPSSMTVTATFATSPGGTSEIKMLIVTVTDNSGSVPTVGAVAAASSTSGLPSASLTAANGSFVFASVSDWNNNTGGTSYGTNQTQEQSGSDANFAWHIWKTTSAVSAGSVTMNMTAPSAQRYDMVILEVQVPSGGGGTATQQLLPLLGVGS